MVQIDKACAESSLVSNAELGCKSVTLPRPPKVQALRIRLKDLQVVWDRLLPLLLEQVASIAGRKAIRMPAKDAGRLRSRYFRLMSAVQPHIVGLGALTQQIDRPVAMYALLEDMLRIVSRASGWHIPANRDAADEFLKGFARAIGLSGNKRIRDPAYRSTLRVLIAFATQLSSSGMRDKIEVCRRQWMESGEADKCLHYLSQLQPFLVMLRPRCPRRPTRKAGVQLANEYRESSAFLEHRLKLLVALDAVRNGESVNWKDWQRKPLGEIQTLAAKHSELQQLAKLVDRRMRNALAHGHIFVDLSKGKVAFRDRGVVGEISFAVCWKRTRAMTMGAMALLQFEAILGYVHLRRDVHAIWRSLVRGRAALAPQPTTFRS